MKIFLFAFLCKKLYLIHSLITVTQLQGTFKLALTKLNNKCIDANDVRPSPTELL